MATTASKYSVHMEEKLNDPLDTQFRLCKIIVMSRYFFPPRKLDYIKCWHCSKKEVTFLDPLRETVIEKTKTKTNFSLLKTNIPFQSLLDTDWFYWDTYKGKIFFPVDLRMRATLFWWKLTEQGKFSQVGVSRVHKAGETHASKR
jgi:hypothetical protein